ncbi:hypothetical protein GUJ93_ZPchr0001g32694 [Zizania palustris]|uniref:Uncharacterized protein n=1 Tax=Zizania palustris TaxID=103762 RepID=A0A8J5V929_ZIZPA|nr:hypothetical protein GUJ93_ZPchr0001g32694 [Zizania palustris]
MQSFRVIEHEPDHAGILCGGIHGTRCSLSRTKSGTRTTSTTSGLFPADLLHIPGTYFISSSDVATDRLASLKHATPAGEDAAAKRASVPGLSAASHGP